MFSEQTQEPDTETKELIVWFSIILYDRKQTLAAWHIYSDVY